MSIEFSPMLLLTKFLGKGITIKISTLLLLSLLFLAAYGLYWLAGRYSVGTFRHAIDADPGIIEIYEVVKSCGLEANKKLLITRQNPNYVWSDLVRTSLIYGHIAVDAAALDNEKCVPQLIQHMMTKKYKTQITFIENGKQILSIDNIDKRGL